MCVCVEFCGGPGSWITRSYTAHRNGGAFLNGKAISVSRAHELQKSLLVTGFGYEHDEAWESNIKLFREFTDESQGVRRLGSAAIDMCHGTLFFLMMIITAFGATNVPAANNKWN